MYIKYFKFDRNKRLWFVMFSAVLIALSLIIVSFIIVYNESPSENKIIENMDIKNINSYKASYLLNIKSNKNQNNYRIEEMYENKDDGEFFEFVISNNDEKIVYTIDKDKLSIKSNKQNLEYVLSDYIVKKENVISMSTFLKLYEEIDSNNLSQIFSLNIKEYDNKISYEICINEKNNDDYLWLSDISKLEVIVNREKNTFDEYIVYDINGKSYIDIIYENFFINTNLT